MLGLCVCSTEHCDDDKHRLFHLLWKVGKQHRMEAVVFVSRSLCLLYSDTVARKMDTVMGFNDEESSAGLEQGGA